MGSSSEVGSAPRRLIQALTLAVFVIALVKRLAGATTENYIGTWSDDFYYYLKTAMNVVAGKGSTFDGSIATNGYHPLWMLLLIALVGVTGSGLGALAPLAVIVAGTTAATFWLSERLAARVMGRSGAVSLVCALYGTIYFYVIAKHGMEINFTVPLMMYLSLRALSGKGTLADPRDAAITGALGGLLVLSRTDSVIFVAMYVLGALTSRRWTPAELVKSGAFFALGFLPVFIYLAVNVRYFGGILPVSGAAKQLAVGAWRHPKIRGFEFSNNLHYAFVFPGLAANLLGLGVLALRRGFDGKLETRAGLLPLLIFPQVFYLLQICMNDWPFWDWYLYPWMAAIPVALALCCLPLRSLVTAVDQKLHAKLTVLGIAAVAVGCGAAVLDYRKPIEQSSIHTFALALTEFSKTHPGRYAMGDRAGMVGFLLPESLLQLEGLMEDRAFLEHIRKRRDLAQVLHEYGIDYYASSAVVPDGDCYKTTEPWQAGPASPRMVGRFCQQPVLIYSDPYNRTVVFALRPDAR